METQKEFPSVPLRLERFFTDRPLFFVTFNTWQRLALLANDAVHHAFREYSERGIEMGKVSVGRYVIMPDHAHLFVRGGDDFDLGLWIRGLKRAMAKAITLPPEVAEFWQPGFFDHVLRSDESYAEKAKYVWLNPVRAGFVKDADDWRYQGVLVLIHRA